MAERQAPDGTTRNFDKGKNAVSSTVDNADGFFNRVLVKAFTPFVAEGYSEPPPVPEENIIYSVDDSGIQTVTGIKPQINGPFSCEYFYTPQHKAVLMRGFAATFAGFLIFLAMTFDAFSTGAASAAVLMFLISISLLLRLNNVALYKWPIPPIPFLDKIDISDILPKREEESDEDFDETMESEPEIEYVTPVEKIAPDGSPSPATILTRWMNNVSFWDTDDLKENSGGVINNLSVKMLMRDEEDVWTDEEILDTLAQMTGSRVSEWVDAYAKWSYATEDDK